MIQNIQSTNIQKIPTMGKKATEASIGDIKVRILAASIQTYAGCDAKFRNRWDFVAL